jgi:hypothetical protein
MSSEWMKVMLEEIARKQAEADEAEAERQLRSRERSDAGKADALDAEVRARKA